MGESLDLSDNLGTKRTMLDRAVEGRHQSLQRPSDTVTKAESAFIAARALARTAIQIIG